MSAASTNYKKLNTCINSMGRHELELAFDFTSDTKKKEAHWSRDKNLRDILIHLYEWHQLVLNWVNSNMKGVEKPFLISPYNWKTYGDMNVEFWKKHQNTSLEEAMVMLATSHKDVVKLIDIFTNEELFSKNVYNWVGGSTLGSYCVSATTSHYDWALRKLKAHSKYCKEQTK